MRKWQVNPMSGRPRIRDELATLGLPVNERRLDRVILEYVDNSRHWERC